MTATTPEPADARQLLHDIAALRRRARRARGGHWFPLTLFGALTLAFTLLDPHVRWHDPGLLWDANHKPTWLVHVISPWVSPIWAVGIPTVYVATVAFYLWRAHRRGIGTARLTYALAGLGLFAVFAILAALPHVPGDAIVRGLTPLYPIVAGLLLLSVLERSGPLAAYTVGLLALALVANLYDIENRVLTTYPSTFVNPFVVAVYLLAGGLGFGLAALRSRERRA
jgi:hypothetical protein